MTPAEIKAAHWAEANKRALHQRDAFVHILKKFATAECKVDLVQEADFLVLSGGFAAINQLPRANETGTKQSVEELRQLSTLATDLRRCIEQLHRTALAALEQQGNCRTPLVLTEDLAILAWAADRAAKVIKSQPSRRVDGAPQKRTARDRTELAAAAYKHVTGQQAAGKPFASFLGELFKIWRETASVAGQIKALEKRPSK